MADLIEFNAELDKFAKRNKEDISNATRQAAFEILSGVVMETPVDTGRARANWGVSFTNPPTGRPLSIEDPAGNSTVQRGKSVIDGYNLALGKVFISNNLKYIRRLNDGYSAQAGERFVEGVVARVARRFR